MWIVFEASLISRSDDQEMKEVPVVTYEMPGLEEYWRQWERDDVLEAEAKAEEEAQEHDDDIGNEDVKPDELDTWVMDRGQYNMRGYGERSDRWYEIPLDYLCMKGFKDGFNL